MHPYGQAPDEPFPYEPSWYFGRVGDKLAEHRNWLDANRTDKDMHVSVCGAPVSDFNPNARRGKYESVEEYLREMRERVNSAPDAHKREGVPQAAYEAQGEYVGNLVRSVRMSTLIGDAILHCYSDAVVPQFGLMDRDSSPYPALWAFKRAIA